MGIPHIYFDDKAATERASETLRHADIATKNHLMGEYFSHGDIDNFVWQALEENNAQARTLLASNMVLRQRINADYPKPFEQALHDEHQERRGQLDRANQHMHKLGYENFDANRLFVEMGVGAGRVMLSEPIIVPYHCWESMNYSYGNKQNKLEFFTVGPDVDIGGLHYNLGFFERPLKDINKKEAFAYIPTIFLDPKVMDTVHSLMQSESEAVRTATTHLLPGMQSLFMTGMHDYVHQIIYTLTNRSNGRNSFLATAAPLENYRFPEATQIARTNHGFAPPKDSADDVSGVRLLELHAELFNRDLWRETFRQNPEVKTDLVRTATQFIADLEVVRTAITQTQGAATADQVTQFMSALTMSRFLRIVSIDDKELATPVTLRNGTSMSFIEACENLQLPAMAIDQKAAASWIRSITLRDLADPSLKTENPRLIDIFAGHPERFPRLAHINALKNAPNAPSLTLTGFENLVARTFSTSGKRMNMAAFMYDFQENDDPKLHTAKIAADFNDLLLAGTALPFSFSESMKQYDAYVGQQGASMVL